MRANRTIGIRDRDRTFKDGLKGLPDIKPLGLAADQHRHRLEFARDPARRLGCRGPLGLRDGGGFARSCDGIELRLQLGLGGVPLPLPLCEPACCFPAAETAEPSVVSAAANCASALSFRFSATRTGVIARVASR